MLVGGLHQVKADKTSLEFAPAHGSPASDSDLVMTSQDFVKVKHVMT